MSEPQTSEHPAGTFTREEAMAALFAQLVLQQTNMAMMLLGKVAHPETGQAHKDIEGARMFIDQLEMLETKTKGNLSKEESALLKQSLMNLRLMFVDAVESGPAEQKPQPGAPESTPAPPPESSAGSSTPASTAEDEHRKKFSKKY